MRCAFFKGSLCALTKRCTPPKLARVRTSWYFESHLAATFTRVFFFLGAMPRHTKTTAGTWTARGGDAPFQSFDTSGRRGDGRSTTPHTPPIERRFSRPGCVRAPLREDSDPIRGVMEVLGPRVVVDAKRHTGFDDTSNEGRTPNKTPPTTWCFSK